MPLFAAAIGHAKHPTSHRDVAMTALEAARLIVLPATCSKLSNDAQNN